MPVSKRNIRFPKGGIVLGIAILLFQTLAIPTFAASIQQGAKCKVLGSVVSSGSNKFKCTKSGTKNIWVRQAKRAEASPTTTPQKPSWVPDITLELEGTKLNAVVKIAAKADALQGNCKDVVVTFYQQYGSAKSQIGTRTTSVSNLNFSRDIFITMWIDSSSFGGKVISVSTYCKNDELIGESSESSITIPGPTPTPSATPTASPTPTPSATPTESVNLTNAKRSAASYLRSSSFSRSGLIKQLIYEGFSSSDAETAVDFQNVDWKAQAAKTAAAYLKSSSFSYAGLLRQLEYEGFTNEQAVFGVASTGLTAAGATASTGSSNTPAQPAQPSAGCTVSYLSPLPYANQRIAITNIDWARDAQGYVTATLTMRNDNSMALRLVEFVFQFFHKGSLIKTTSTLEGDHHFFIQDDAKFNSFQGPAGPWNPGQTRTFKIPTNQILDCSSIQVLSSGFLVKQGIGAS